MYQAIVAKIDSIEKIEGADRIVKATILGTTCIVSAELKVGDVGILFGVDGCLSDKFATENKLYKHLGGYLESNARIRCLKLKQVKSDGLFMPLESLSFLGRDLPAEGTAFTERNGVEICKKYVSPETLRAQKQLLAGKKVKRGETEMFKKHIETEQLMYNIADIKKGERLIITAKVHGTSQRYGHVLDVKPQSWIKRVLGFKPEKQRVEMAGTRNVIINDDNKHTGFHDGNFRDKACEPFQGKLHKGEVVYYEVVGWENKGKPIMGAVSFKELDKDKQELYKENEGVKRGQGIIYTYGCADGVFEVYVYRICMVNEDGIIYDYSWDDLKKRCNELDVKHVPELKVIPKFAGNHRKLQDDIVKNYESQPDWIDPTHPAEGICLRREGSLRDIKIYKYKNYDFKLLEGIIKSSDSYVDTEEAN